MFELVVHSFTKFTIQSAHPKFIGSKWVLKYKILKTCSVNVILKWNLTSVSWNSLGDVLRGGIKGL